MQEKTTPDHRSRVAIPSIPASFDGGPQTWSRTGIGASGVAGRSGR